MSILKNEDHRALAIAAGGRIKAKEVDDLRTVPWGYYLLRSGRVGCLQADHLFKTYYKTAKGHEFLCYKSQYPLETVEACVYLRGLELLAPVSEVYAPEAGIEPTPKRKNKRNKRNKKGGK